MKVSPTFTARGLETAKETIIAIQYFKGTLVSLILIKRADYLTKLKFYAGDKNEIEIITHF
mgnify:CR=1 FL=1